MSSVTATVLSLVLFVTYIGIGALAHDTHFSLAWALMSTALVWAGPAQIILISTLASGATIVQTAIAVTVSAIRLHAKNNTGSLPSSKTLMETVGTFWC